MASSARIEELRKKFEENPRRYFAPLANEYRKAGDVDEAIAICRDYLPQQPGHMSGHIVYGQALYEARQYEEAKSVFETALALDPENLIALRHLGDICLLIGDIEGARGWYGRVLDADPRNEEIQAQLQSLEASSAPPGAGAEPTPVSSPAVAPAGAAPTPAEVQSLSTAPTVVVSPPTFAVEKTAEQPVVSARPPEPSAATPASSAPTAEILLDQVTPAMPDLERARPTPSAPMPEAAMASGFEPTSTHAPSLPTQPLELDRVVPEGSEAPATDFRLEGLETTSMGASHKPPESSPEPSTIPLMDLEISTPAESPMPVAEVPGAAPSDGSTERGAPAVPELLDLSAPPPITAPVQEASAVSQPAALSTDLPLIDLGASPPPPDTESGECDTATTPPGDAMVEATAQALSVTSSPATAAPGLSPAPTAPTAALASATPAALVPSGPPAEPAPPVAEQAPPVVESRPFVTETMAELYEQQGHRDEALRVYRALLEQRPGDVALQGKIDALLARQGPTIRELLARVASRRPASAAVAASGQPPAETMDEFSGVPAAAGDAPETGAAVADTGRAAAVWAGAAGTAEDTAAGPTAEPATGVSRPRTRPDTLATLFGSAPVSASDETAAQTLAGVFARAGSPPDRALDGAPARPAAKDLSLDAVFGKEGGAQPSTFSFDQFFSQRSTQGPAAPARGTGDTPESADDIAKFTQWLEGLKPR